MLGLVYLNWGWREYGKIGRLEADISESRKLEGGERLELM
jgi:hypothetical protein